MINREDERYSHISSSAGMVTGRLNFRNGVLFSGSLRLTDQPRSRLDFQSLDDLQNLYALLGRLLEAAREVTTEE